MTSEPSRDSVAEFDLSDIAKLSYGMRTRPLRLFAVALAVALPALLGLGIAIRGYSTIDDVWIGLVVVFAGVVALLLRYLLQGPPIGLSVNRTGIVLHWADGHSKRYALDRNGIVLELRDLSEATFLGRPATSADGRWVLSINRGTQVVPLTHAAFESLVGALGESKSVVHLDYVGGMGRVPNSRVWRFSGSR